MAAHRGGHLVGERPAARQLDLICTGHVVAELVAGITTITHLRSEAPILLRPTPVGLYLVGGAAGPLGGDRAHLTIELGPGANLVVHSTAASLVLPGRHSEVSTMRVDALLADGSELRWLTEPTVLAERSNHRTHASIHMPGTARLVWREELILGRHLEPPGSLESRMDCLVDDRPVLRNAQCVGADCPGWDGPAVLGGAKAVGSVLVVTPRMAANPPEPVQLSPTAAVMPLTGPAAFATALADDSLALRRDLDTALSLLTSTALDPLPA